jgi:hypothetical protein
VPERLLTPQPYLVPSLKIRNGTSSVSGEGVREDEREVTYVSRLHMMRNDEVNDEGEWGRQQAEGGAR